MSETHNPRANGTLRNDAISGLGQRACAMEECGRTACVCARRERTDTRGSRIDPLSWRSRDRQHSDSCSAFFTAAVTATEETETVFIGTILALRPDCWK